MKSKPKKLNGFIFWFVKSAFFVTLIWIFYNNYVKDIIRDYRSKLTNTATYETQVEDGIRFPTLTFCTNPNVKKSYLEKYKFDLKKDLALQVSCLTCFTLSN